MVLATSAPVTEASKKDVVALDQIFCICYLILFKKNKVQTLINFDSKVNAITSRYALKLDLKIRPINVGVQKINGSTFKICIIVLASFQIENKLEKVWFFQKMFLLVDFNIKVVLRIFIFTLSNINI